MSTTRTLPLPEGLAGLRLDVAMSRLLGLSRTTAAALVDDGQVLLDGEIASRSAKVHEGSLLEVTLPDPDAAGPDLVRHVGERVAGLGVIYDDDDLVVIDKPVGVAAHPSPG